MDSQEKSCPNSHTASAPRPQWDIPVIALWLLDLILVAVALFGVTHLVRWTAQRLGGGTAESSIVNHKSSMAAGAANGFFLARFPATQDPSTLAQAVLANYQVPGPRPAQ